MKVIPFLCDNEKQLRNLATESPSIHSSNSLEVPEITLSALSETGKAESTIPVGKQRSFTGPRVITSSLADTPVLRSVSVES